MNDKRASPLDGFLLSNLDRRALLAEGTSVGGAYSFDLLLFEELIHDQTPLLRVSVFEGSKMSREDHVDDPLSGLGSSLILAFEVLMKLLSFDFHDVPLVEKKSLSL